MLISPIGTLAARIAVTLSYFGFDSVKARLEASLCGGEGPACLKLIAELKKWLSQKWLLAAFVRNFKPIGAAGPSTPWFVLVMVSYSPEMGQPGSNDFNKNNMLKLCTEI